MRPGARTKSTKDLKENTGVVKKSKIKSDGKITKTSRKALADKTNSLSDDNASIDVPIKTSKKGANSKNAIPHDEDKVRPRRERRLPPRFIENETLNSLSNSQDSDVKQGAVTSKTRVAPNKPAKKALKTNQAVETNTKRQGKNVVPLSKLKPITTSEKSTRNVDKQVPITKFLTTDNTRSKRDHLSSAVESPPKVEHSGTSPFKTPVKDAENSLITNRPKRVSRLPSRFEEHSISPSKFIPVQPCHASTPIVQKTININNEDTKKLSNDKENKVTNKRKKLAMKLISKKSQSSFENISSSSSDKTSPDTNNNGKKKVLRSKRETVATKLPTKQVSPKVNIKPFAKRLLEKSLSFRVLEDRKSNDKRDDVYEFTFDPKDEPPPQKKKRKKPAKPTKKRQVKPKIVIPKSNYDDNVSKALESLRSKVKPSNIKAVQNNEKVTEVSKNQVVNTENDFKQPENYDPVKKSAKPVAPVNRPCPEAISKPTQDNVPHTNSIVPVNESINSIHASNYASIRVEDIAADFEFSDNQNDINYSPVNSPHHQAPEHDNVPPKALEPSKHAEPIQPTNNSDPLNLHETPSFFDDAPVASSSMNISVRHPLASPWRVEFGSLPMKWHNNTYVKSNMTPAVESSFVNSEATKKKHVYTNMLPEQEPLPEIFENTAPALKQTSIISFIKEVAERNLKKKKRRRSKTPPKAVFNEVTNTEGQSSPKKTKLSEDSTPNTSNNSNNTSKDKENSTNSNKSISPQKKKKNKDQTFFGFDDTENTDQENVSPVKVKSNPKTRVLRSRNVLQELNTPAPTRAAMPVSKAKLPSSEVVEQLYDQLKSTEDAQFPRKEAAEEPVDNVTTNVDDPSWQEDIEDAQSCHLFEDIDVVHHLKLHRKSYGKAKKVTFQQSVDSDSDDQPPARQEPESDEDDLADLSFHLPDIKETKSKRTKKKKPKKLLTKKEEKEAEEWAAGFNSMCEDIEEFPLLVE